MKVTNIQLEKMQGIAAMHNHEAARDAAAEIGLRADTTFSTYAEKLIALECRKAMYDKNGHGWRGCINEIRSRIDRTEVTCQPMRWADFNCRKLMQDDQRIRRDDGRYYRIEHKSGAGDWYTTDAETLAEALEAYRHENKVLVWTTADFQLVMPFADFIEGLEGYGKGAETFFKKTLVYRASTGKFVLQMQTYTSSEKKKKFLRELAAQGSTWKGLYIRGELD